MSKKDEGKDHVVLVRTRWTNYTVVHPVPFTKEEAEKFVSLHDKTNSVCTIHKLISV